MRSPASPAESAVPSAGFAYGTEMHRPLRHFLPSLRYQTLVTLVGKRIDLTRNSATDTIFIININFIII
jgi:hypothetical protein